MRNNTKKIITITALVTFSLCFAATSAGYIFIGKHYEDKYREYRNLERKFYTIKLNDAKKKLKLDGCK